MRQNNNIIKPRDISMIRTNYSSVRGIAGVRSSDLHAGATITPENEARKGYGKRKFPEPNNLRLQNISPHACPNQHEPIEDSRSDAAAKTSEYAYFQKLKKKAGQSELYSLHREKSKVANVESQNYATEKTSKLKQINNGLNLSVPYGTGRSGDHTCFSPPVRSSNSSKMTGMAQTWSKDNRFPSLNKDVAPISDNCLPSAFQDYSNDKGVQHSNKGIFASKRQKLHQWVASTLHQDIKDLSSKGFDLVSVLLKRLFPEDNKENRDWEPEYIPTKFDARDQLPLFPDKNTHSREHYQTHKNHLMECDDGAYQDYRFKRYLSDCHRDVILSELDDARYQLPLFPDKNTHSREHYQMHKNHLLESDDGAYQNYRFKRYLSDRHRDVVLSELDDVGADSLSTSYPIKTYFPCKYMKSYRNVDASITEILSPESNSCFQLQSANYGSIAWEDHFKEFDLWNDPNSSPLHEQPHNLLLGWENGDDKNKQSSSISSYNKDMSLLTHSGDTDYRQTHDRKDESALCSSCMVSNHFLNCSSLTQASAANFGYAQDFGGHLKHDNYHHANLDHFPVAFSCNPDSEKYLYSLLEGFSTKLLEPTRLLCSPQNHFWNLNNAVFEDNVHELEALFFSAVLDRELRGKPLLASDLYTENKLSIVHAFQNRQHVVPMPCFFGEEDKECLFYSPSCTNDYSNGLNFQDLSAINFQISCYQGDSLQRYSDILGLPILERNHAEVDDNNECRF